MRRLCALSLEDNNDIRGEGVALKRGGLKNKLTFMCACVEFSRVSKIDDERTRAEVGNYKFY